MSFSDAALVKKLGELTPSQQSIQTLSLWLIHHRKHSKNIVQIWMKEMRRAKPTRKLTFLYLANDVIQNSRKKGPEFHSEFKFILGDAFRHAAKEADYKSRQAMSRIINIWKERGVYEEELLAKIRKGLGDGIGGKDKDSEKSSSSSKTEKTEKSTTPHSSGGSEPTTPKPSGSDGTEEKDKKKKKRKAEPAMSLKEEIEQEFANGPREPPEPEDLVKELQELESSASSDAAVREQIAALPPSVSDLNKLDDLVYKSEGRELQQTVKDAIDLLTDYNGRLASELQDRKKVARMLRDYLSSQKDGLAHAETRLEEYKSKLSQVEVVRKELKAHIQSLPDLNLLPDVTGGLAPLPSAGDLFSKE